MDQITPDAIAKLATRIYQETGAARSPPASLGGVVGMPAGAPPAMAVPSAPSTPSVPSVPSVGSGGISSVPLPAVASSVPAAPAMPLTGMPAASLPAPVSTGSIPFQPPTAAFPLTAPSSFGHSDGGMGTHGFPSPRSAAGDAPSGNDLDGVKAFVQGVRRMQVHETPPITPPRQTTSAPQPEWLPRQSELAKPPTTGPRIRFSEGGRAVTPSGQHHTPTGFDVNRVRADFPVLQQSVNGHPLAWFDNAATTQKPQSVIDALVRYYSNDNSNIHRAAHTLAARSTDAYEQARGKVQKFIGAGDPKEIVFVRGTTEGINFVANTFGRKFLRNGDDIVLSELEHHANIVPWQLIARETGAHLRVIPVNDRGEVILSEYERLLGPRTKLVAITHASNSLGTVLPVAEMTRMAKRFGARVLIDGAQTVAHMPVRVQDWGSDFFVFSGHKVFGPTGIGAVYVAPDLHDLLPPWQGGGNMIRHVTFEETQYAEAPAKFEAGTPNIADAVGLGEALDYVSRIGLENIAKYEHELLEYATSLVSTIPGVQILGTAREKVGVLSFVMRHRRPEEVGKALDQWGIAVRAGHHCAQPSLRRFGVDATVRPSFAFYNTFQEIDRLGHALRRLAQG